MATDVATEVYIVAIKATTFGDHASDYDQQYVLTSIRLEDPNNLDEIEQKIMDKIKELVAARSLSECVLESASTIGSRISYAFITDWHDL